MKIIRFLSENSFFGGEIFNIFSIYLNRRVFVMCCSAAFVMSFHVSPSLFGALVGLSLRW